MRPLLIAFAFAAAIIPALRGATPEWTGDPAKGAHELEQMWQVLSGAMEHSGTASQRENTTELAGVSVRGVFRFALEAAALPPSGWHPERVEAALRYGRSLQDCDPSSRSYGNFKWVSNADRVYDYNAVEFVSQLTGLLHTAYGDRLTPAVKKQLAEIMTTSLEGLDRHAIKLEYTNITLMKAWDYIALGEALGHDDVAAKGYARLDDWLRFTAESGITEFGAITYYGIDLDSLAMIAKYAKKPDAREKAMKAIRYLWTDAAANWWTPGDRLGGANSRSYDYLWGHGYFESHTWTAGWLRKRPALENAGWLPAPHENLVALLNETRVNPPPAWTEKLRHELPRTIVQRTGPTDAAIAVTWMSAGVSLATSGMAHGSDDRTLGANLGATPDVAQMTLFMDGRGDPFGTKKTKNAAGQAKALHIVPFVATVQRGPEALQILSSEPLGKDTRYKAGELSCLLTHLTIPVQAEVWCGEQKTKPGTPEKPAMLPDSTPAFVRLGNAVIAMRILFANTTEGKPALVEFVRDGAKLPANRLTIVHDTHEPRTGRATVAVWLRAADGLDDAAFARFRKEFSEAKGTAMLSEDGRAISVTVAGLAGNMRIEADLIAQTRNTLQGGEPRPALLSVNGHEEGLGILGEFLTCP